MQFREALRDYFARRGVVWLLDADDCAAHLHDQVPLRFWEKEALAARLDMQAARARVANKRHHGVPRKLALAANAVTAACTAHPTGRFNSLRLSLALAPALGVTSHRVRQLLRQLADQGHPCFDPDKRVWRHPT